MFSGLVPLHTNVSKCIKQRHVRGLDYIGIFLGLLIQCIFTIHRPGGVKLDI